MTPKLQSVVGLLRTYGSMTAEDLYARLWPGRTPPCRGRGAMQGGPSGQQVAINFLMGRKMYRERVEQFALWYDATGRKRRYPVYKYRLRSES